MFRNFLHKFWKSRSRGKDDRKYFTIVFFILILFILSAIISPILVKNKKQNWNEELTERINNIQSSVLAIYQEKENHLLQISENLKKDLTEILSPGNISYGSLLEIINRENYKHYSIEVFAPNGKLIAWNDIIAIPQEELFPLEYPAGEAYFFRNKLVTFLSIVDTLQIEHDLFYYTLSIPVEKHYSLQNQYYSFVNLTKEISDKFLTEFEIAYNPFEPKTKDGRKYSFEIVNNAGKKTGLVTFIKPSLDTTIKVFNSDVSKAQSFLVVLGFLFIAFALKKDFTKIKYRSVKLLLFVSYLAGFRLLFYYLNFPSNILQGQLTNPAYFSSAFGEGIVKSPVELFITILFVLITCITAFRYIIDFVRSPSAEKIKSYKIFFILIIPIVFLFFLTIRGLAAAIRSVIFDSTLRYFKDPTLIPDLPSIVMNINTLALGVSVVLLLCGYLILLISFLPYQRIQKTRILFFILFLVFEILGVFFIIFQRQPLLTPGYNLIFVLIVFLLTYHVFFSKIGSIFNYVYVTIAASIITIVLLNFFNLQLEREALKTTALEINRPNDNLLRFLIRETLLGSAKNEEVINTFSREKSDYDAAAFIIWSSSSLHREALNSAINIYDISLKPRGSFSVGINKDFTPMDYLILPTGSEPEIREINLQEDQEKIFVGVISVIRNEMVIGFITAAVNFDLKSTVAKNIPDFIDSKKNIFNSTIDVTQLKIFEFEDEKLTNVFGDIYPSRDQIKPLLSLELSADNEAWTNISLNGENYTTYILKTGTNGTERITTIAFREKHFTWNLFNFFKIFILHSLFILPLFLFLFTLNFKKFRYSFRIQLLITFLVISILPVIVLAIYNRFVVTERSHSAILSELIERSDYVSNHVQVQKNKYPERDFIRAFDNAGKDLGISFSVYENTEQIYNSNWQFIEAGLFTSKLNPEAHYNLNYLSYREFFTKEKINNYNFGALYKKISFNDRNFIIEVNDAFNKINVTFSVIDADIFLFGVYSFAVIIIIVLSTLLANKISSPIRRLKKATDSVAHGDLNVQLENTERGEIKELIEGFNMMTKELKKNQTELAELEREGAWKEMAKQVAHEIKNPLTPMKLAVQQLVAANRDKNLPAGLSKNFDEMFEKLSSTILNQIENLNLIASEFSRFARMPHYKLEKVDLIPVIFDTINLFVDEKIKIEVISDLKEAIVEADKSQLQRMIINFIRNSIQAESTKISISILAEEKNISITIEDNGKGIPVEHRHKIFESDFTTKEKGMGIGLKLAKRFLEGINGYIELISSSGEGTIFKIIIPAIEKVRE